MNWDVIHSYTRAQAIEDGVLVDVSETAKEAGLKFPTAITSAAYQRYVELPRDEEAASCQDVSGRLWDVLFMLVMAVRMGNGGAVMTYQLVVNNGREQDLNSNEHWEGNLRCVTLKAVCGPGDKLEPVVTIMLPSED